MHHAILSRRAVALTIVVTAISLTGCGGQRQERPQSDKASAIGAHPNPSTAEAVATDKVAIDNFAFSPATIVVPVGATVTWTNRDDVPHTATSAVKPRVFDSGTLDTDQTYKHQFTAPGTYAYFCAVHPHMTGTVIVK